MLFSCDYLQPQTEVLLSAVTSRKCVIDCFYYRFLLLILIHYYYYYFFQPNQGYVSPNAGRGKPPPSHGQPKRPPHRLSEPLMRPAQL
jgi:hypothetical protein